MMWFSFLLRQSKISQLAIIINHSNYRLHPYEIYGVAKGQLISKGHFGVFKSTKKPTKML
jgi:hypothetical protein